jgi:catechol 2,3-dioxygenase-like lactoylglutathione lyase family enzyme
VIDHLGIQVSDLQQSKAFYLAALAPLGYSVFMEFGEDAVGFQVGGKPDFWLESRGQPATQVHVAFGVEDRPTVDAFHEAAVAAGGRDNGGPGVREIYHPHYYGAFVLDPDGNNVEAVCHKPA